MMMMIMMTFRHTVGMALKNYHNDSHEYRRYIVVPRKSRCLLFDIKDKNLKVYNDV